MADLEEKEEEEEEEEQPTPGPEERMARVEGVLEQMGQRLNPKPKEYAIYDVRSLNALLASIETVQVRENDYINTLLFCTRHNFFDILSRARKPNASLDKITGDPEFASYALQCRWGRKKKHSVSGQFVTFKSPQSNVYLVLSISTRNFWQHGLLRYFGSLYPYGIWPFFKQAELGKVMRAFENSLNGRKLRIKKTVSKGRITSRAAIKKFESDMKWTDKSLDEAFKEAREEGKWFKSIDFEIPREKHGRALPLNIVGKVSKYGWISCNGEYNLFYKGLISPMVELGNRKFQLFLDRSRRDQPNLEIKPIAIEYDSEVFKDKLQTEKFVSLLQKLPRASCSVIHSNPYVHLAILDYKDFSSYEIWVLNTQRILIVPQVKTSEVALRRLCAHIFEEFEEGEIREVEISTDVRSRL